MKYLAAVLLSIVLFSAAIAQTSQFTRLDTSVLNSIPMGPGIPCGDGGTVVMVRESGLFSLEKLDAEGAADWRRRYPPAMLSSEWDISPTANGDILLAYSSVQDVPGDFFDTVRVSWELWRIGADGDVIWRKVAQQPAIVADSPVPSPGIRIVETDQADIFLVNYTNITTGNLVSLTNFTGEGLPLWSRRIGDTAGGNLVPFPSDILSRMRPSPDPNGGCRLVIPAADFFDETAVVVSIAADGGLAWGRLFDYLGFASDFSMAGAAVAQNGNTLFQTFSTSDNGDMHLVRISTSGDLLSVEQYGDGLYCENLINDQGTLRMVGAGRLTTLSESGDLLVETSFLPIPSSADSAYGFSAQDVEVMNGRACFSGSLVATPTGAGLPLASLATRTFSIEGSACGLVHYPVTSQHVTLPNSIFTCEPITSMVSDTLVVNISDGAQTYETRPLLATSDMCSLLVNVPELMQEPGSICAFPSPAEVGNTVTVQCKHATGFLLFNVTGSAVRRIQVNEGSGKITFSSVDLAPGLYSIVAFSKDGQRLATAKVEVQ